MGNTGAIKGGEAYVQIGGDDTVLKAALDRAAKKMQALGKVADQIGRTFLKIGAAIVTPFIAAEKVFADSGAEMFRMSQRTGIMVEHLSALGYAAQQSGVDMETLEMGIKKMQKAIGAAAGGSSEAIKAFADIGLSVRQLEGLSPEDQFAKIAQAVSKIHDPTAQAAEAMKLFGRNGTQMLPLLQQGSRGIEQLERRAKALGIVMGGDAARGAAYMKGRIQDLSDVLKNSFFRAGEAVAPIFIKLVEGMTRGAIAANKWISANGETLQTALRVGAGIAAAGVAFLVLGKALSFTGSILNGIGAAFGAIRFTVGAITPLLAAMLNPVGLLVAGLASLAVYFAYSTETGRDMLKKLGEYFNDLWDVAAQAFGGIADALSSGQWRLAADVAWAGLKLAWAQGIAPLKTAWIGLTSFMETLWSKAGNGLAEVMFRISAKLKSVWIEFKHWLSDLFASLTKLVGDRDEEARHKAARAAIHKERASGHLTHEQQDQELAKEDRYHDKQMGAVDDLTKAMKDANDAQRDAAIAGNKSDLDQKLKTINQVRDADVKRINDEAASSADANQRDLDAKKAKLNELNNQAKAAAKKLGQGFGALPALPALQHPNLPNAEDLDGLSRQVKSAGTFSAAGAFGLAQSIPQRQLEEARKHGALLQKIADNSQKMVNMPGNVLA